MGIVWAATNTESEQPVALKFMKAAEDKVTLRRRFLREARAASAIEHPNVVRILEVLDLREAPVIVMERLRGHSLAERLAKSGPLEPAMAATMVLPVVSAVSAAHTMGIVHRDLKPDNIFIDTSDDTTTVKVLDFGIAKLVGAQAAAAATAHATTTGALLGTPAYMSPEQVFGEKDIDHRADIWSLGMILYESLTGVLPTRADNVGQVIKSILTRDDWRLSEVAPDLPEDLVNIVTRMLSRNRDDRPSLREVGEVLENYADARGVRIQSEPPPRSLQRHLGFASTVRAPSEREGALESTQPRASARARRSRALLVAAALIGLVAGGWFAISRATSTSDQAEAVQEPGPGEAVAAAEPAAQQVAAPPEPAAAEETGEVETIAGEPAHSPVPPKRPVARRLAATAKPAPSKPKGAAPEPDPPAPPPEKKNTLQSAVVEKPPF